MGIKGCVQCKWVLKKWRTNVKLHQRGFKNVHILIVFCIANVWTASNETSRNFSWNLKNETFPTPHESTRNRPKFTLQPPVSLMTRGKALSIHHSKFVLTDLHFLVKNYMYFVEFCMLFVRPTWNLRIPAHAMQETNGRLNRAHYLLFGSFDL